MYNAKAVLLATVFGCACVLLASAQRQEQDIKIHGTVKDSRQRRLEGISLRFAHDNNLAISTRTDGYGNYVVRLPVGTFLVSTEANGFCPYTKNVSVPTGVESLSLDLTLVDCSGCDLSNIDLTDQRIDLHERTEREPVIDVEKFRYRVERAGGGRTNPEVPAVYYGTKSTEGANIVYKGISCPGWPPQKPAILSYRQYVLKAPTISYSPETHLVSAGNGVELSDDQETKHFASVKAVVEDEGLRITETSQP